VIRNAVAAIFIVVCMTFASSAFADCTVGIVPERLSCLNQELQALRVETSKEIAGLKADNQMLRNQLLGLRQVIDGLPPSSAIVRFDEEVNVLWSPQDGCLAWNGPEGAAATPNRGGTMEVFVPCSKAPATGSVIWRLRRAPAAR